MRRPTENWAKARPGDFTVDEIPILAIEDRTREDGRRIERTVLIETHDDRLMRMAQRHGSMVDRPTVNWRGQSFILHHVTFARDVMSVLSERSVREAMRGFAKFEIELRGYVDTRRPPNPMLINRGPLPWAGSRVQRMAGGVVTDD